MTDTITIEVNGNSIECLKGQMLIDVADQHGIEIPRFCYHRKLSVAANCRMCLVDIEKAPKPMPACATPVNDGMVVRTRSVKAIDAQKTTMEFLLINHPLDCPVCDQGGECELQDVAMGYGGDVSQYSERKRVVRDKNIGPLIATDMTRCIHCTRCVRFGEEIAGLPELGATGRGENVEIGTYIEKSVSSELSGNVIDLCPVGALTSKPSRYRARPWELIQHASVSPHDCIGSNLYVHTRNFQIMRVVPRDNERVNQCWIADRDRFSYSALQSENRLLKPRMKVKGEWQNCDWQEALQFVAEQLAAIVERDGASSVAALAAPSSSLEEFYLLQELMRGLGSGNIDHRLRQVDFRDQDKTPVMPWLGMNLSQVDKLDAALLVGSNLRKEVPLLAQRLRQASLKGARIHSLAHRTYDSNFNLQSALNGSAEALVTHLAATCLALVKRSKSEVPELLKGILQGVKVEAVHEQQAADLAAAESSMILLGLEAQQSPYLAEIRLLATALADISGSVLSILPEANAAAAWLAGCLPHRTAAGTPCETRGKNAAEILSEATSALLLLNVNPLDCANPGQARKTIKNSGFVVALSAFDDEELLQTADVILPLASFLETGFTHVNAEGRWQSVAGVAAPAGQARPGWKVLTSLQQLLFEEGAGHDDLAALRQHLQVLCKDVQLENLRKLDALNALPEVPKELQRIGSVALYGSDSMVRESAPLQHTAEAIVANSAALASSLMQKLQLSDGDTILVKQDLLSSEMTVVSDDSVPDGCVWIASGVAASGALGSMFGSIVVEKV